MKAAKFRLVLLSIFVSFYCVSCANVAISDRTQFNVVPDSIMNSMSSQQYGEFIKTNKVSKDVNKTRMVKRAGARIQKAVEQYFAGKNQSDVLANYAWEFNLVDNKQINAWCMPGGKVVVYTGILDVAKTETGLAVVMGHEIAHAIAKHGGERMTQNLIAQMGGMALSVALKEKPEQTKQLWGPAVGAGTKYLVLLPFSRLHEKEADHLGLIFMAMAGYDPNEAVAFWQRMSEKKGGKGPSEFMSTHPSDATRIAKIREAMPEAMEYYRKYRK